MRHRLQRLPWWVSAPGVVALTAGVAGFAFVFTSDLFNETCVNERNLLTGELAPSNCGEGAKLAAAADIPATPSATDEPMDMDPTPTPTAAPATPQAEPSPTPAAPEGPGVLASGMFQDGEPGHDGSGGVELQRLADGSFNVFLNAISVTNGPDLFVVLSRDPGGDYSEGDLVLDGLSANHGNQNYAVPAGTDISEYHSVIIWCRSFDVVFAFATLEETQ